MTILKTKKTADARIEKIVHSLQSTKPLNLAIDGKLLKEFKIATIRDGTTMTDVLTRAMREYLTEVSMRCGVAK